MQLDEESAKISEYAHKIMDLSRTSASFKMKFLSNAITFLQLQESQYNLAVDGEFIYYNPMYVIAKYKDDATYLDYAFLHMTVHCLFQHLFMRKQVDHKLWNAACDIYAFYIINSANDPKLLHSDAIKLAEERSVLSRACTDIKILTPEHLVVWLDSHPEVMDMIIRKSLFLVDSHDAWYEETSQSRKGGQQSNKRKKKKKRKNQKDNSEKQNEEQQQDQDRDRDNSEDQDADKPDKESKQKKKSERDKPDSEPDDEETDDETEDSDNPDDNPEDQDGNGEGGSDSNKDDSENSDEESDSNNSDNPGNSDSDNSEDEDNGDGDGSGDEEDNEDEDEDEDGDEDDEENEDEDDSSNSQSQTSRSDLAEKWKNMAQRAQTGLDTGFLKGDGAGNALAGLQEVTKENISYEDFLRKFSVLTEQMVINMDEFDYSFYTYGLQLYGNVPLIEPLEYKDTKRIHDFVIAIDTSGSTFGPLVQKFLSKTFNILSGQDSFDSRVCIHIIQCDTRIHSDVKIEKLEDLDEYMRTFQIYGGGGTDFRPVFEYVDKLLESKEFTDLRGLIYFTDGFGHFPHTPPQYETAFTFVGDDHCPLSAVPDWAITLELDENEFKEVKH